MTTAFVPPMLFARVATIPQRWLMPAVLVLCAVAAYSDNNNPFDVWVMVGAGLLGYAMRGLGYDPDTRPL